MAIVWDLGCNFNRLKGGQEQMFVFERQRINSMKKCLIVSWIFALMLCCRVLGQNTELDVTNGLAELATNNLAGADTNFQNAVALEPTNQDANVLLAITRLLLVPQTPAGSNFL